jgi:hypothetical protein
VFDRRRDVDESFLADLFSALQMIARPNKKINPFLDHPHSK